MKSFKVLAFVATLLAAACSSDDRGQTPPAQPDPPSQPDAGQPDTGQPDSGQPEGQPLPGMSNVRGALDQSVKASIGPAGGKLETSHGATSYTLTVPAGALADAVEITLVPVVAVPGVDRMAGGWHALPEGLTFLTPATLDVRFGAEVASDATGFAYAGDGMDLHEYPVEVRADGFTFPVLHFSGGGSGGSVAGNPVSAQAVAMQTIARELKKTSPSAAAIGTALAKWYDEGVRPGLAIAAKDPDPMRYVDAYTAWRNVCDKFPFKPALASAVAAQLAPVIAAADALAASVFKDLIAQDNAECAAKQSFEIGERAIYWQRKADTLDLATADFGLNLESILPDLCIQISFEELTFPQSILSGESGTLDVKVGYQLGDGAVRFDKPIELTLTSSGTSSDGTTTHTPDADGKVATSVIKNGNGNLSLTGKACLVSPREICQPFSVLRGSSGKTFEEYAAMQWFQAGGDGNGDWLISFRDLGGKYLFMIHRDPHNGYTYPFVSVDLSSRTATGFSGATPNALGSYMEHRVSATFSEEADGPHMRGTVTLVHMLDMPPTEYPLPLNAIVRP